MSKILLIDDSEEMRKVISSNLSARGYGVIVALNGELGLQLAKKETPDLIILDMRLPGIPGLEVLKTLKRDINLKNLPVVVLTASGNAEEEKQALSSGARKYLVKPFQLHSFLESIREILNNPVG